MGDVYITAQGHRLRNDLYCVEWDVKLHYTIPYGLSLGSHLELVVLMLWVDCFSCSPSGSPITVGKPTHAFCFIAVAENSH